MHKYGNAQRERGRNANANQPARPPPQQLQPPPPEHPLPPLQVFESSGLKTPNLCNIRFTLLKRNQLALAIKPQYSEKHKNLYLSSPQATIVCFRRFVGAFSKAKRRLSKRDASNKRKSAVLSGSPVTTTHHVLVVPSTVSDCARRPY